VGRFYSLSSPPHPNESIASKCVGHAWSEKLGSGLPFSRGFCRGVMPYDGDILNPLVDLSYDDDGHGVWRLFLREEERSAGKMLVQTRAHEMALEADPDSPLSCLHGTAKKRLMEDARKDVLERVLPKMRIVPVLVSDDWAWVGRRSVSSDRSISILLSRIFGASEPDPLVFDEDTGWSSSSYAVLKGIVESGSRLSPDVTLLDIDISDKSVSIKATGVEDTARLMLEAVEGHVSETSVKRMSFEVYSDGCSTVIDVDSKGFYRGMPPRSVGGLPHERVLRRFSDVRQSSLRIKEVMHELVDSLGL